MKSLPAIAGFLLVLLAGILSVFIFRQVLTLPGPLMEEKLVYIEPGTSVRAIAEQLGREGVIMSEWAFKLSARLQKDQGGLKAGEYQFTAGMSEQAVIDLLRLGKTYRRMITIPEGLMSSEIAALVDHAEAMSGAVDVIPPEGSLLPETYDYSRGDSRTALIGRMQKSMQEAVQKLWAGHAADLPLKTPEEAVVLASIVEKETGIAAERARIAGVFVNRLKKGMPLQSDPTVIYALTMGKEKLDRALTRNDLGTVSPYNTYLVRGLPPGPIANPGMAALAAVMNPEVNDFLYFVADGSGGHAFGTSLKEHEKNVLRWRSIQKAAQ